jgi:hypothetical protein
MLLVLALVAGLYLACFFWFRSLCRAAIRSHGDLTQQETASNLIPFERGLALRVQKTQRAV